MLSKFFIYRPIFAGVISIVIVVLGLLAMVALPIARYPEIAPPTITISAAYPGADAQTVAETVATPIEQEVNGVEGMLYMSSSSSADGTMSLSVTFESGVDLDNANVLVQNRVALAEPSLPEEVRRLGVSVRKRSNDIVLLVSLVAPNGEYDQAFLLDYANQQVRDEITRINGVGDVQLYGVPYAMRLWLDPERMRARGLTASDVIASVREQNVQVAAGKIGELPVPEGQAYQFTVTTQGRLQDIDEFESIVVKTGEDGQLTMLGDVARIELGQENYAISADLNGQPAAVMAIYQLPGSNAIEVADEIKAKLAGLSDAFPEGMEYRVPFDATLVIRSSIKEVVVTLFITLALVVFTVYIFLQNFRATLIPAVTIPVSLIGTFAVMLALGYTLNILTLFGLVLVIGIVVDDAIVVVENTTRLIGEGLSPKEAAVKSMQEVTGPVIATTLVLLSVFVPTLAMGGITGMMFQQFAVTISVATVFSSINALTLSPALCGVLLRAQTKKSIAPLRLFNRLLEQTTSVYVYLVQRVLRLAVVGLIIFAGLIVLAGYGLGRMPGGFVPQEDEGYLMAVVQLPDGASLERTYEVTDRINEMLADVPGVKDYVTVNGLSILDGARSSNAATVFIILDDWDERTEVETEFYAVLQSVNVGLAPIQEANAFSFPPPSLPGVGFAGGFSMQLQDRGGVGSAMLQQMANELSFNGNSQPQITRMYTSFRANVPQLFLDIDREQVKAMNVPMTNVFDSLSAYMGSAYINDMTRFGRIYQVRAQAEGSFRDGPEDLTRIETRNSHGEMVPLGAIMEVQESFGPEVVTHFNIYPSALITGQTLPGYSSGQAMAVIEEMAANELPSSMGFEWTDLSYQEKKAGGGTELIYAFALLMVYLVLAAQYESWTLPLAVVLGVPTALMGAVLGATVMGLDNNVYTQIGIVLLIGLSAKTSILIVEFAKSQRDAGMPLFEAAVSAAKLRFRAVLMTAFSFILGVLPLLVATGAGAASRRVLGTVVFSGMLVATVAGVLAVPMLFRVVQGFSEKVRGISDTPTPQPAAVPATSPETPDETTPPAGSDDQSG